MWFTDPKTKKKISFRTMLVHFLGGEVFLSFLNGKGDPVATVSGGSPNAKAAYRACKARGLVAAASSEKARAFMDPKGLSRDRFDGG